MNPFIIAIHCSSHRIALCMKDATEHVDWVRQMQAYLTESFGLMARSPKKHELFKVCAELMEEHCISPKKLHAVRWHGFVRCIEQQWQMADTWELFYKEVVDERKQPAAGTAQRLLNFVRTLEYKLCSAYLYDVLTLMQTLSATVQARDINFEEYAGHLSQPHVRNATRRVQPCRK